MNEIIQAHPTSEIIVTGRDGRAKLDAVWWQLFDPVAAVEAVDVLLADKGSDGTRERHTRKVYERGLRYFLNWAGPQMAAGAMRKLSVYEFVADHPTHKFPGPMLVREFVAHLKKRGLKKATIESGYMAALRHYIRILRKQYVSAKGEARDFVGDCKDLLMHSLDEKVSADEERGEMPALYQYGERLTVTQVDALFVSVAQEDSLKAKRDLALLYIGFNAALREAEMRRLKLSSIRQGANGWELHVRGKRNNRQPVPLDKVGYALIMDWVAAFNEGLAEDDVRRIGHVDGDKAETVIFQPLQAANTRRGAKHYRYDPKRGLGKSSLAYVLKSRSGALGGIPVITPHDMRRTAAFIGRQNGMEWDQLQMLLRHKSIDTTRRYVGNPPDLSMSLLSRHVTWSVGVGVDVA